MPGWGAKGAKGNPGKGQAEGHLGQKMMKGRKAVEVEPPMAGGDFVNQVNQVPLARGLCLFPFTHANEGIGEQCLHMPRAQAFEVGHFGSPPQKDSIVVLW